MRRKVDLSAPPSPLRTDHRDLSAPPSPPRTDHRRVYYALLESQSVSKYFTFELVSGVTNREASYRTVICCQRCNHDSVLQFDAHSTERLVCVKCANTGSFSMVKVSKSPLVVTRTRQVEFMFIFSFRGFEPYRRFTTLTKWSVKADKTVPIDFREKVVQVRWNNMITQPKPRVGGGYEWMPADAGPYCEWLLLAFKCSWKTLNIGPVELNDVPPARSGPPVAAGAEPSIQNGISSMPVTGKSPPGNLAQGSRVPARKYIPDPNRLKVPFFSDEEIPKLSNRDDRFKVRDNPETLNVPARSSAGSVELNGVPPARSGSPVAAGAEPSIQNGISSMPVTGKPPPGNLAQESRVPARKYIPDPNRLKVPFFSDEEIPKLSNRDDRFKVRDNPETLNVPARSSAGSVELNDVPPARSGSPVAAGAEPSIQNGISSMPVTGKPPPGNLAQESRVPARKYIPDPNRLKVPFFSDEEIPKLSSRDDRFKVRDNPGALNVSARSSAGPVELNDVPPARSGPPVAAGAEPSIQNGISLLPVTGKPPPGNLAQESRVPARKYIPDPNRLKVPFFSDEEIPKLSNRDDRFKVRDNPGALNAPARSSAGPVELNDVPPARSGSPVAAGAEPSIQNGISSMPMTGNPPPGNLAQESRVPARKYIPGPNHLKVPFFSDEEIPKLSNRDDRFKVRDNPGA